VAQQPLAPAFDFENLLKQAMGLDSVSVGSSTIDRAVRSRMADLGLKRREDYWERVQASTEELQELIEAVVVPETSFFRDREAFAALIRLVAGKWLPNHPTGVLRVLSVPCSTGEEPYSIAMALLDGGFALGQFEVDAVDISTRALAHARRGVYGGNSFRGGDLSFRERHFRSAGGTYTLGERLTEKVNFCQGNLLSVDFRLTGPKHDVIFCRNLLIYFDRETQQRAMTTLENLLAPDGFLFVGPAEAFLASCSGFASVNQAMSFAFRRTAHKPVETLPLPVRKVVKRIKTPARLAKWTISPHRTDAPPPLAPAPPLADLTIIRRLADAGRLQEATLACNLHLQQHGPSADAYYLLGLLKDAAANSEGAADCYRRVLYLDPNHSEALLHLALLTETLGNPAAAERLRQRARRVERNATA
jgi:chemotaxis protein methyltransferase WspC